jgi:hypothetical protein
VVLRVVTDPLVEIVAAAVAVGQPVLAEPQFHLLLELLE